MIMQIGIVYESVNISIYITFLSYISCQVFKYNGELPTVKFIYLNHPLMNI